ncbi:hypothetical protein HJC23_000807 [Cyclotella cryptica]|uniref:J domain-containing protein n=1 Tax=Cyclotella cryptica TaxID=29204 RepID=A0ABD3Q6D9_9STRA|eukprot:CCRYP_008441-RA/>CCRYP_008441-RA protein AED:0.03 eAED:0.03 QI:157/1/1/1/1/1/3/167/250
MLKSLTNIAMRRHWAATTTAATPWTSLHPNEHITRRRGGIQTSAPCIMVCNLSRMRTRLNCRSIHRTVQAATNNYFQTMGIDFLSSTSPPKNTPKQSFTISPSDLKSKYKRLMKDLHPDRHAALSQEEKSQKALQATNVTRAYSVLKNPLSRALHLLELWGASIDESDNSIIKPHSLLEIMEMREAIEHASNDEQLKPLLQTCQSKQAEVIDDLAVAFREKNVKDAKYLTASLQYWSRIEERILEKITVV